MRRPVLVTGARGFVGTHLIEVLRASGHLVFAWERPGSTAAPPLAVSTTAVDVLDATHVRRELASLRPEVIFHCAGAAHLGQSWRSVGTTLETNVLGTHHLLESDRRLRLRARILIPGSAAVYRASGEPLAEDAPLGPASPYAVSKLAQELVALRAASEGQHVIVTRSFNHIGPGQASSYAVSSFARQIAALERSGGGVIRTGNLAARRDLTDVRDTVRAYVLLADHGQPGTVYNVCSGAATGMDEVLDRLRARARVAVQVEADASLQRPNDSPVLVGDNRLLIRTTGWHPSIPLDRTLDDLLEYWRQREGRQG